MANVKFFPNGSFVVHGITPLGYKGRFSVWCNDAGEMVDCERSDIRGGRAVPRNAIVLRNTLAGIAKRLGASAKGN